MKMEAAESGHVVTVFAHKNNKPAFQAGFLLPGSVFFFCLPDFFNLII